MHPFAEPDRSVTNSQPRYSMPSMNTPQGKIALVTGAASGIWDAPARQYCLPPRAPCGRGAGVLPPKSRPAVSGIRSAGGRALGARRGFLRGERHVAGAVALAVKEYGASRRVLRERHGISGGLVPFFEETAEPLDRSASRSNSDRHFSGGYKHAALAMVPRRRGSIICTASASRACVRAPSGRRPTVPGQAEGVISPELQTAANQLAGTGECASTPFARV